MIFTSSIQLQVLPRLNGKNFNSWFVQMKVLFKLQYSWSLVENSYTEVADAKAFEALRKEEKDTLAES